VGWVTVLEEELREVARLEQAVVSFEGVVLTVPHKAAIQGQEEEVVGEVEVEVRVEMRVACWGEDKVGVEVVRVVRVVRAGVGVAWQ
jgi:hypothetical protein